MKYIILLIIALSAYTNLKAQKLNTDTIGSKSVFENINNSKLFSDSLVSSFIILVKKEVKEHKHIFHSEHVIVVDGEAEMTLDDSSFTIRKGDIIFIPKNTFHSVKTTSSIPLKVVSIQAPFFDGNDRLFKTK